MPLRVAGAKASKSLAVSSLDRIDKWDETLPRRRMELQSKAIAVIDLGDWWLLAFLPLLLVEPFDKPACLDLPRDLVRDELFRIGVLRRRNCA
jgi:hypothetical protein